MSNTITSPNMNLPTPVTGVDPGPDWANNIVACLGQIGGGIDSHDHSAGKGVPVTPDGINISKDLPFNSNNATLLRSVRFVSQSAVLSGAADTGCIYVSGSNLYFNNSPSAPVQLTNGSSIAGTSGSITGLTSPASASFSSSTFVFQSAANTPAAAVFGPITIRQAVASGFGVIISPSASQTSDYNLTMPAAAPTANQILVSDGSGNFTWTRGLLPLGSIIATFPNLSGAYTTSATTSADANGFVQCNGQTIVDATSPMNGAVIPNISNNVFIYGSTVAGSAAGSTTVTLGTVNLPSHTHGAGTYATSLSGTFAGVNHTHGMAHYHQWATFADGFPAIYSYKTGSSSYVGPPLDITLTFGEAYNLGSTYTPTKFVTGSDFNLFTTGVLGPPNGTPGSGAQTGTESVDASLSGSNAVTGTSGATGSGTAFSILPPYITAVYLMRVK